jgi:hypothetical protein
MRATRRFRSNSEPGVVDRRPPVLETFSYLTAQFVWDMEGLRE